LFLIIRKLVVLGFVVCLTIIIIVIKQQVKFLNSSNWGLWIASILWL
jgi:hypothetical protein